MVRKSIYDAGRTSCRGVKWKCCCEKCRRRRRLRGDLVLRISQPGPSAGSPSIRRRSCKVTESWPLPVDAVSEEIWEMQPLPRSDSYLRQDQRHHESSQPHQTLLALGTTVMSDPVSSSSSSALPARLRKCSRCDSSSTLLLRKNVPSCTPCAQRAVEQRAKGILEHARGAALLDRQGGVDRLRKGKGRRVEPEAERGGIALGFSGGGSSR